MTTADTPHRRARAVARGWRNFRRWRRGRPFWGGLLTILSAVVFFYSGHLTVGGIKIVFSPQEFLGWVIPLVLLLCGLLMLVTPAQRIFYGVLAAAVSVGGLLGLNLGGFFLGMLLGIVGGALGASWAPVQLQPVPPAAPPADDEPDTGAEGYPAEGCEPEGYEQPGPEGYEQPGPGVHRPGPEGYQQPGPEGYEQPGPDGYPPGPDREASPPRGPLTDTLPTSMTSPLAEPPAAGTDGPAQDGGWLPRRSPRGLTVILLVTTAAVGLTVARAQTPAAAAAACGTSSGTAAGVTPVSFTGGLVGGIGNLVATVTGTDPSGSPSPSGPAASSSTVPESPSPSPAATPSESTSPQPTGTTAPAPTGTTTPSPKSTPTASPTPTCPAAKVLIPPADRIKVSEESSQQITALLSQMTVTYDGVTELPTAAGTVQVLQFSMDSSTSTPFELRVPVAGLHLVYRSSQLTVAGHVRFYTSRLDGKLGGVLPQSYTPETPPPLPPGIPVPVVPLVFTDVSLELVLVRADVLTAPGLSISYES